MTYDEFMQDICLNALLFVLLLSLTMLDWTEAAVGRCSSKMVFLKILQYSQENTCVGVFLN